jgi:hypothetical protein
MSHITQVVSEIDDEQALRRAMEMLGVPVLENTKPRYYRDALGLSYQSYTKDESVVCDFVLTLPGKYDLGLKRNQEGKYEYVCDNELLSGSYGKLDLSRRFLGDNAEKLMTAYGNAKVELMLLNSGIPFERVTLENGDTQYIVDEEHAVTREAFDDNDDGKTR